MPAPVLLRSGGTVHLSGAPSAIAPFHGTDDPELVTWLAGRGPRPPAPAALLRWLRSTHAVGPIAAEDSRLLDAAERAGLSPRLATVSELRAAREGLRPPRFREVRGFQLAVAREQLAAALADPEESLISLAREEERLERALGREDAASALLLLPAGDGPGQRYRDQARNFRSAFEQHHAQVRRELADLSAQVAPNLTRLVGNPLAARLIATAGSVRALARMSGARIQLLGSRRRPSPVRGPRYGHLYRAPRLSDLPPGRAGAYARSLAALAAIAARADAITHAPIADLLIARRDRRHRELMGRR